ncbi:MAG: hypothetical protein SGPRY_001619 [Prymnesium sp.]
MVASLLMDEIGVGLELLAQGVREATCRTRGGGFPPRTWLRSMKELQEVVEGSVLVTNEGVDEPFWFIPVSRQGGAAVRRVRGEPCVRVSRDGAEHGTSYVKLSTLHEKVEAVAPAIARRSAERPGRVWAIGGRAQAREVFLSVGKSNEGRMAFTLCAEDDGEMIESGSDLMELLEAAGCQQELVQWSDFSGAEGWGLPTCAAWEDISPRVVDDDDPSMEIIASALASICGGERPGTEERLWEAMVRMTEAHPHAINRGEFNVATQRAEMLATCFSQEYVQGMTEARAHLYHLLEVLLSRFSDQGEGQAGGIAQSA